MELKETLAISGHSGLFKFVSQGRNGIVVEAFADKKRSFIPASTKVSSLDDIAIYTSDKEMPIKEVFKCIFEKESGGKAIDAKAASADDLKKYMEKILPEYDRERVYVSDIKKLISWYNILHEQNLLKFDEEEPAAEETKNDKTDDKQKTDTEKVKAANAANEVKTVKAKTTKAKDKSAEKETKAPAKSKAAKATKKEKNPVK